MITVVHCIYNYNPLIKNVLNINMSSLDILDIPYQYILFNDKGDKKNEELISKDILNNKNFEYIYSDVNYGRGVAGGGWIGAIPRIKYEYYQCIGQDDIFFPIFYSYGLSILENNKNNGIVAVMAACYNIENFQVIKCPFPLNNLEFQPWLDGRKVFEYCFDKDFSRAWNFLYFPGTIYASKLHQEIGLPDIENFDGAADFEYWVRIIFNGYKIAFNPFLSWLYMLTKYSHSTPSAVKDVHQIYHKRIIEKYKKLYDDNGGKIIDRN